MSQPVLVRKPSAKAMSNTNQMAEFVQYCVNGNYNEVAEVVKQKDKIDINWLSPTGVNALSGAALKGQTKYGDEWK